MLVPLLILLVIIVLLGGGGFFLHLLWIALAIGVILWLLGFLFRGEKRWYRM